MRDDPENYLIAKCVIPVNAELDHCPPRERGTFMHYDECPAKVLDQWDSSKGTMVLVLQPPPPGYKPEKTRRKRPSDSKRPLNQNMSKPKPPKSTNSLEPGDQTFVISDCIYYSLVVNGRFRVTNRLILNDGRGLPEITTIIFFSEKFVF